jgi:hypothetical protein
VAEGLAERLARLVLLTLAPVPEALALVPEVLVPEVLVPEAAAVTGRDVVLDRGGAARVAEADVVGLGSPGAVAGLNVATESIAPATRHTARMLASSGMTVGRPAKGPASRRSRFRRRFARCSRW